MFIFNNSFARDFASVCYCKNFCCKFVLHCFPLFLFLFYFTFFSLYLFLVWFVTFVCYLVNCELIFVLFCCFYLYLNRLDREFGNNTDWESHLLYGELLQYQYKRYNDAEDEYLAVIEINPRNALAYYHMAFLQRDCMDNVELGIKYFDQAKDIEPKHPSKEKFLATMKQYPMPINNNNDFSSGLPKKTSIYDKFTQGVRKISAVATSYANASNGNSPAAN